jgi:hypothetical protein
MPRRCDDEMEMEEFDQGGNRRENNSVFDSASRRIQ